MFHFVLTDRDKCKFPNADSLQLHVKVLPPENEIPWLQFESLNSLELIDNSAVLQVGEVLEVNVIGNDTDQDNLLLELVEVLGPEGNFSYTFSEVNGQGTVVSPFLWNPQCTELAENFESLEFEFRFALWDDKCFAPESDTLSLSVTLKDLETNQKDFVPPM